jgi:type IV secretory pathway VirD2 relaxase
VHKITLAPEINPGDKKAFTREVMKKLGSEKGLDLQWMAVEHNNTDHHHIHVVILGKDKNGTDVRIDKKDYDKIKDYGDRYLERVHPLELERARTERERKEKEPDRSSGSERRK